MRRLGWRLAFVAALGACNRPAQDPPPPPPPTAPDSVRVRTALESLAQHYKVYTLNRDARGIASLFTTDGGFVVQGLPTMVGPVAIDAGLRAAFSATKYTSWDVTFDEIRILGPEMAVATGSNHSVWESKGKAVQGWHRWMAAYRKGGDGMYRFVFFAAFADSTK